ncbi:amidohydrolase [Jeotgalibacillus proteolyticus]|uniref:Amidohydrolase n=1 Tax=Jeotgalibacillus proteolyticus TaxID=2082395 RepID=A0A2S5GDZ8_9BACL|nr:amidohydrolase [Jeotgalibacillus proteolyticus]PPA71178.1 amidohydrolase [Jeotgalibacillus proteolyticus]
MGSILLKNAVIYPITSPMIEFGDVLVTDGIISEVKESINPPKHCTIYDCSGQYLIPGLIDVHTHLGLYDEGTGWAGNDANESIEPLTPHIRAIDGIYPLDEGFRNATAHGITTVNVLPGSANVIGGVSAVIKTHGKTIPSMVVKESSGLKIALGENPKRMHSNGNNDSITRMGIMGMLREAFYQAKHHGKTDDFRHAPIQKALKREIPVRIHAHRADDIVSAIRFAEEFNLDLRIEHCTEGHLIIDELKRSNSKVCIGPTFTRKSKVELKNKSWKTYHKLADEGIDISITTDHPYTPIQYLNVCAAIAVREGLSVEKSLEAITMGPARNLGIADKVGSIEPGKEADLVLWTHHPFHFMAKPAFTMIKGEMVFIGS